MLFGKVNIERELERTGAGVFFKPSHMLDLYPYLLKYISSPSPSCFRERSTQRERTEAGMFFKTNHMLDLYLDSHKYITCCETCASHLNRLLTNIRSITFMLSGKIHIERDRERENWSRCVLQAKSYVKSLSRFT